MKIFISHSTLDKEFVLRLAGDLKGRADEVWVDSNELKFADSIVDGITSAIEKCNLVLVTVSENWKPSKWCHAELRASLFREFSGEDVRVVAIRLDDTEVPTLLRDRIYADFQRSYEVGLQTVLAALDAPVEPIGNGALEAIHRKADVSSGSLNTWIKAPASYNELLEVWRDSTGRDPNLDLSALNTMEAKIELLLQLAEGEFRESGTSVVIGEGMNVSGKVGSVVGAEFQGEASNLKGIKEISLLSDASIEGEVGKITGISIVPTVPESRLEERG